MTSPILQLENVTKRFGGLTAVNNISLDLPAQRIISIIGPNGAGKTTLFNIITGIYTPDEGTLRFDGLNIAGRRPDQITALGMCRTFQNIRLFQNMSVIENVLVGAHTQLPASTAWGAIFRTRNFRNSEESARLEARSLLRFVGLPLGTGDRIAKNLPYGQQRKVEIARALAAKPKLILLDEPTAGMNPQETEEAILLFRRLRDELGVTVLLIEHDMKVIMGISERISVIDYGQKIAEGTPAEVRKNQRVIEAYLGRQAQIHDEVAARQEGNQTMAALLELRDVHSYYGQIQALKGVSLSVNEGEIVTLIGSNGAGKSTTLRTISGLIRPRQGEVLLSGKSMAHVPPHQIVKSGIGHVPEGRGVFPKLTVLENLEMGAYLLSSNSEFERRIGNVFTLFPRLKERMTQNGGTLSGGEQQMLAIGRALMQEPRILLLDEPSMGLAPLLVEEIFNIVQRLNSEQKTTILLVEQNAQAALLVAHRAYVMETGKITISGDANELLHDPRVIDAYLGL